jgi:anti-sigma regulatory factor (Ser/Thr protein kinase)
MLPPSVVARSGRTAMMTSYAQSIDTDDGASLRMSRLAAPAGVGVLRRAAAAFAARHGADSEAVAAAVSEAVSNAVMHAYVDRPPGPMTLTADALAGSVRFTVTDEGRGLTPRRDSPGLGVGLSVIAAVADHVEISAPRGGGTSVRMTFRTTRSDGAPVTAR